MHSTHSANVLTVTVYCTKKQVNALLETKNTVIKVSKLSKFVNSQRYEMLY